jgi:peptidoglycan/xylan/chitin deacetylase (PgdA/CDA1 family)
MGVLHAEEVAITIDDPNCGDAIYYTHQERDQKILDALQKHHIQAAYYVVGSCVDNPEGKNLLKKWDKMGILMGNHTYSHKSLNDMGLQAFENDTLKNEKLLMIYKNYKNILRFPYLKEGNTIAKRNKFRIFLSQHHYVNGSVTIDASDWYIPIAILDAKYSALI